MAVPEPEIWWVYQGVVVAEVSVTLLLFLIVRTAHFLKWGHLEDEEADPEQKKEAETDQRRWPQASWDIYFPIIFANHVIALGLPLTYTPSVILCVVAWIHFGLFVGILIVNIFVRELEPGQGGKTKATRILWLLMCLTNIVSIVIGLAGINSIIV